MNLTIVKYTYYLFYWSCTFNNIQNIDYFFENLLIDVNKEDNLGRSSIFFAATRNNSKIFKNLIDRNGNIEAEDNNGWYVIHWAAREGNLDIVKYLIEEKGVDNNFKDRHGMTPLMWSTWEENLQVLKYLVKDREVDLNEVDNEGYTALQWAVKFNNAKAFEYLLQNKADQKISTIKRNQKVSTPTYVNGDSSVLQIMTQFRRASNLETLKEFLSKTEITDENAFIIAAKSGHYQLVKELITKKKIDIDFRDSNNRTSLIWSTINNYPEVSSYLITSGANLTIVDNYNKTALNYAAENKNTQIFYRIMNFYIDELRKVKETLPQNLTLVYYAIKNNKTIIDYIKEMTNTTESPLLIEAIQNYPEDKIKQMLDDPDTDFRQTNLEGENALMVAAKIGNNIILKNILDKNKIDVDEQNYDGKTALMLAAERGHLTSVETLIEAKSNLNSADILGKTALMAAAQSGKEQVIEKLLAANADYQVQDSSGKTALMYASEEGQANIVSKLMDVDSRINKKDVNGLTPLMYSAKNGHLEATKLLLDKNAKLEKQDNQNKTALMMSIENGHTEVFNLLLSNGAKINGKDNTGKTALLIAAKKGNQDIVDTLLTNDASIKERDINGKTALMISAENGHTEIITILIDDTDINIDDQDVIGKTALMYAIQNGKTESALKLIDEGIDIYAQDMFNQTAFMYSAANGNRKIIDRLLDEMDTQKVVSNIDHQDINGRNSLMLAILNGQKKMAEFLSELDGDNNLKDNSGKNALMYAAEKSFEGVVDNLMQQKINMNEADYDGKTALMYAATKSYSITNKLLRNGGDMFIQDNLGYVALTYAIQNKLTNIIDLLINDYILINFKDRRGKNILMHFAQHGLLNYVKKYASWVNVNEQDNDGYTVLSWASTPLIVKHLVEKENADLYILDKYKQNSFFWAAWYGKINIVKYLLQYDKTIADLKNIEGRTPIYLAIQRGHFDVFKLLLENTEKIDGVDKNGKTLLMIATEFGRQDMVELLVNRNNSIINSKDNFGRTALFYCKSASIAQFLVENFAANVDVIDKKEENIFIEACRTGVFELIKYFNELEKFDINYSSTEGITALIATVQSGNLQVFKYILGLGAEINQTTIGNRDILSWACQYGSLDIVKSLIEEHNLTVDSFDNDGFTPIVWAASYKRLDVVKYLAEKNANLELPDKYGQTVIYWACWSKSLEIVKFLVEKQNVSVNVFDNEERSPFHIAANYGALDIVKYFVESKIDMFFKDRYSRIPVYYAVKNGHLDILKFFVKSDRNNLEIIDGEEKTPLIVATEYNHLEIARYLIGEERVEAGKLDKTGKSALMHAAMLGYQNLVAYLISNDDINAKNEIGWTPLFYAIDAGKSEIAKFIVDHSTVDLTLKSNDNTDVITFTCKKQNVELASYLMKKCPLCEKISTEHCKEMSKALKNNI